MLSIPLSNIKEASVVCSQDLRKGHMGLSNFLNLDNCSTLHRSEVRRRKLCAAPKTLFFIVSFYFRKKNEDFLKTFGLAFRIGTAETFYATFKICCVFIPAWEEFCASQTLLIVDKILYSTVSNAKFTRNVQPVSFHAINFYAWITFCKFTVNKQFEMLSAYRFQRMANKRKNAILTLYHLMMWANGSFTNHRTLSTLAYNIKTKTKTIHYRRQQQRKSWTDTN